MAPSFEIATRDGRQIRCICVTPTLLCVDREVNHMIWIIADMKKRRNAHGGLPELFTAHVLPFLEIFVCAKNLWDAFGINSEGFPQRGTVVRCTRLIKLLSHIPTGRLLGLDWQFPGVEGGRHGGYSLLHRACDPALQELHEGVALCLLQRMDFRMCNAQRFGVTALHFMAARGWANACRSLIQRRDFTETLSWVQACIESSNGIFFHPGDTVLDVARGQNHMHVVQAVRETLALKNQAILNQHGVTHF